MTSPIDSVAPTTQARPLGDAAEARATTIVTSTPKPAAHPALLRLAIALGRQAAAECFSMRQPATKQHRKG